MTGQCPPSHLLEASQETGYDCYVSVISVPFVSRVSRVSRVPSVGESLCISLDPNGSNTRQRVQCCCKLKIMKIIEG